MAYEICAQSLRTVGAACGGAGVGTAAASTASTSSSGAAVVDGFSSRRSWSPPTHLDFGVGKSLQKVHEGRPKFTRHTPLRPRVIANSTNKSIFGANSAENSSFGFFGALTLTQEGLLEKPCAQQPAGPGSSTLEKWLERYLAEIVRHLPEAPFMQFVPEYNNVFGERQQVSEELFEKPESWTGVKECLLAAQPDGLILVHRLDQEALSECCMNDMNSNEELSRPRTSLQVGSSSTDVWGVLVHGCKTRYNSCYILKTTQVVSSTGIMTHFSLSRAKCFGPSLKSQLQSTWLL